MGLLVPLLLALAASGCAAMEKAAARDPIVCERDPACERHLDKSHDCATACADDIACMRRCEEIRGHR
jgi:hypothetical protein